MGTEAQRIKHFDQDQESSSWDCQESNSGTLSDLGPTSLSKITDILKISLLEEGFKTKTLKIFLENNVSFTCIVSYSEVALNHPFIVGETDKKGLHILANSSA